MQHDIDVRIASAFGDGATSEAVATLVLEVDAACVEIATTVDLARSAALDPVASSSKVASHRREMDDALFRRDRLVAAKEKLAGRLSELRKQEHNERLQAAYNAARDRRDALATELAEIYQPLVDRLVDLIARVDESDREIEHINVRRLPAGAAPLLVAELAARDLKGFTQRGVDIPRITKMLRVPSYAWNEHRPFAWPTLRR